MSDYAKKFELAVKQAFEKVPNTSVDRVPDPTQGFLGVRNICDFVVYRYPTIYYIECKSLSTDSRFSFTRLTKNQWDGLIEKSKINGVVAGVMVWFIAYNKTYFIPIRTMLKMYAQGKKSVTIDFCKENQDSEFGRIMEISGRKKRVLFEYNMTEFLDEFGGQKLWK